MSLKNKYKNRFPKESSILDEITELVGKRLSVSRSVCESHGRDESYHKAVSPDAVVFVESTKEVSEIIKICSKYQTPVIPFGTGTSLEGHVAALEGGICIDLSKMNKILEVNEEDLDCTVQAGVTRLQLNNYLRDTGLFFPIDPGADASLGGMTATRASGTCAVKYGTMRDLVLKTKVVLPDGRIIDTGTRSRKSSAGYDITRLMVGSEGTLGVITEVSLKLFGIPESITSAICFFPNIENAVNTVISLIQSGSPLARIEFLDELAMASFNSWAKTDFPESPALFFEFHGSNSYTEEQAKFAGDISKEFGGSSFKWASNHEERNKIWRARHDLLYAVMAKWPGTKCLTTDVCVPISKLAECIDKTKTDILSNSDIPAPFVGHVGDGNFHVTLMIDPDNNQQISEANILHDRLVARALAMGGTCTGEHGIGHGKIDFLNMELGETVSVMRSIKKSIDPHNIMNPSKVVNIEGS